VVTPSRAGWTYHHHDDGGLNGALHRWSVMAAVAALVVLVALIALVVLGNGGHRHPRPSSTRTPVGTSAGHRTSSGGPVDVTAPAAAPLTSAPSGVVWQLVDGVALPSSSSDGPARVAGGVPSGFAHTPTGALLACVQIGFRLGSVNPADQAGVVRAMVIGAGRAALLASRPAAAPAVKPQLAGFRYLTYTPALAVIGLAWRVTDAATGTTRPVAVGELQMSWAGGDWRLVDDGTPAALPTPLDPALTGYIAFAGA
jgi:hypothetical protein